MATITKGKTFSASETVTNTKLHQLVDNATITGIATDDIEDSAITSAKIANETIVNADISASAAIVGSKLDLSAPGAIGGTTPAAVTATTVTAANVAVNANGGVKLTEGTAPSTAASQGALYTKDSGGQPELFYREESDGTEVQITNGGSLNSGAIVQVKYVLDVAVSTSATLIPEDDTIPQKTEGTEWKTIAITPASATNILQFDVVLSGCNPSANYGMCAALFQDDTAGALACVNMAGGMGATSPRQLVLKYFMAAGTTSETTFKVRFGQNAEGTMSINGISAGRLFGGVQVSTFSITEIVP